MKWIVYDIDENPWDLKLRALQVMRCVKCYQYFKGGENNNRYVKLKIEVKDNVKFTPVIFNQILYALRRYYGGIVLIFFKYPTKREKMNAEI